MIRLSVKVTKRSQKRNFKAFIGTLKVIIIMNLFKFTEQNVQNTTLSNILFMEFF